MTDFKSYLLSVTVAAVVCGIIKGLVGEKFSTAPLVRLLCGIYLACTLIYPIFRLDARGFSLDIQAFNADAQAAAIAGEEAAAEELAAVIKSKAEAYILDKASAMEVDLDVEITLDNLIPSGVQIKGAISPYVKSTLSDWIAGQLEIPKEAQEWIG